MEVRVHVSKMVKPLYEGMNPLLANIHHIPLSPFDQVTDDAYMANLFAYRPPTPPNSAMEASLAKTLAAYREWAGQLGEDDKGNPVILLSDKGVRFVEATVDDTYDRAMPLEPSPSWLNLHPSPDGVEELFQVQLTRFGCGTLVVGFSMYHRVADGPATLSFLVAWCRECSGIGVVGPLPLHDRAAFFTPREPAKIEYEHRGVELTSEKLINMTQQYSLHGNVATHRAHFSREFVDKLKDMAFSESINHKYSTFECLVAHLWRTVTKARRLPGKETTHIRISVDGRTRMVRPRVPKEYFGNLILWAYPRTKVRELTGWPLNYTAELIHREVAKVDDRYFKSFIDFANSEMAAGLVPTVDPDEWVLTPNVSVDSWLRFPIREMDFGGGRPFYLIPSYYPVEGQLWLVPSFMDGDHGGIDAYVSLFEDDLEIFKQICHSLDYDDDMGHFYKWNQHNDMPMPRL
ncbi:agmatine coumaroyltransferase-2-like [Typha angustifolia]|uniref:agmatine coumaroyltransferase-2-like n=1 Tax=Typha angustifolia TaxID=59011 RepID=UPI003C2AD84A